MPSYWSWEACMHLFRYLNKYLYVGTVLHWHTNTPNSSNQETELLCFGSNEQRLHKIPLSDVVNHQIAAFCNTLFTSCGQTLRHNDQTKTISCIRGSAKPLRGWTTSRSISVFVVFSFIVSLQSFHCCVVNASQVFCVFIFPAYNPH